MHEQRLGEQVVKIERPIQPFEAAGESGRMPDGDNDPAIQSVCEPIQGKNSERILEQWMLM